MKLRTWTILIVAALAILAIPTLTRIAADFGPALTQSNEWSATYREGNGPLKPAKLYLLQGSESLIFVHTPDVAYPMRWFALDLRSKEIGVPGYPQSFPYLHVRIANIGVSLLDSGKLEDSWKIDWKNDDRISFTNGQREVVVSRQK